jgi:hypothetical protein
VRYLRLNVNCLRDPEHEVIRELGRSLALELTAVAHKFPDLKDIEIIVLVPAQEARLEDSHESFRRSMLFGFGRSLRNMSKPICYRVLFAGMEKERTVLWEVHRLAKNVVKKTERGWRTEQFDVLRSPVEKVEMAVMLGCNAAVNSCTTMPKVGPSGKAIGYTRFYDVGRSIMSCEKEVIRTRERSSDATGFISDQEG